MSDICCLFLFKSVQSIPTRSDGLQPNSDGLQPISDGLQPNSDGLQPSFFSILFKVYFLYLPILLQHFQSSSSLPDPTQHLKEKSSYGPLVAFLLAKSVVHWPKGCKQKRLCLSPCAESD